MAAGTEFDYYYGDESNQFSFYRIPRQLVTRERFKRLSTDAKLLYGLLMDRMSLSAKNGWYDESGRVYIYYTLPKGGFTMLHYRAIKSGIDIAKQIADLLESLPIGEQDSRAAIIRNGNDVLQGRSDMSVDMLLSALRETGGPSYSQEVDRIQAQIEAFLNQMALRGKPYRKTGCQEYEYKLWDFDPQRPLKVIEQELFDHAAEYGFPPDFFKDAYFDHVTVYCMPDGTDCSGSHFQDCSFTACGIRGAVFDKDVMSMLPYLNGALIA